MNTAGQFSGNYSGGKGRRKMPKFLEKKLKAEYGEDSKVPYKVMNKIGAMRGNKETAKGRAMAAKHKRDMGKGGKRKSRRKMSEPASDASFGVR